MLAKLLKYDQRSRRRTFLILALFQILVMSFIFIFCSVKYEVSDDFIIELILSGTYGSFDPRLLFSNVILGYLLYPFYMLFPTISWFFVMQMFFVFCGMLAVAYMLSQNLSRNAAFITYMVFTIFLARDLYLLVQFTKTATFTIAAGMFLFLWSLANDHSKRITFLGICLTIAGALLRFSSVYLVVFFAVPYLIYVIIHLLRTVRKKRVIRLILSKVLVPVLVLTVLLVVSNEIQMLSVRSDPEYQYYKTFSKLRSDIVDYPRPLYHANKQKYWDIGIKYNDYRMIFSWNMADSEFFNLEKMQEIQELVQEYGGKGTLSLDDIRKEIAMRKVHLYPGVICCFLLALLCILYSSRKIWAALVGGGIAIGLIVYFVMVGRSVYRVESGVLFAAAILICTAMSVPRFEVPVKKENKYVTLAAYIVSFVICTISMLPCVPDNVDNLRGTEDYHEYIDSAMVYAEVCLPEKYSRNIQPGYIRPDFIQLAKDNPDNLYLLDFETTIQRFFYDFPVIKSAAYCFPKNLVYMGGVTLNHPFWKTILEKYGVNSPMELITKDNVYVVDNHHTKYFSRYLRDHRLSRGKREMVDTVDGFNIWKYR